MTSDDLPAPVGRAVDLWWWSARLPPHPGAPSWLDAGERARLTAFRRRRDGDAFVSRHAGLRLLLARYLRVHPTEVLLGREACPACGGPHGRPALVGPRPVPGGLQFSISSSGDVACCAVSAVPVGVDVEASPAAGVGAIATMLHPAERSAVAALPVDRRTGALTRAWVRKEAYLKGVGTGIARGLSTVRVGLGPQFSDDGPFSDGVGEWLVADVDAPPGFAAAVALAGHGPVQGVRRDLDWSFTASR